jgi:hypothetical protein
MRKPIIRAAIYALQTSVVPEGADPYEHEVKRLALYPEDLLADKPTFRQKQWALETMLKINKRFPNRGGGDGTGGGDTQLVRLLQRAARKRDELLGTEAATVEQPTPGP